MSLRFRGSLTARNGRVRRLSSRSFVVPLALTGCAPACCSSSTARHVQGVTMYLFVRVDGPAAVTSIGTWANRVVLPDVLSGSEPESQSLGGYVSFGEAAAG